MTSLTEQQQELVARNLSIVHWVICDYIHVNPTICGMEYGDLFQEGCLWLCKAASTYKNDGRAQFSTYAKTVVKNGLLSYCRAICNRKKNSAGLLLENMENWRQTERPWSPGPTPLTPKYL